MNIILLIIQREFLAKVRNKSFIVMTFLSPLLFVGIAAFVGYLSSIKSEVKTIAIHDASGLFAADFKNNEEYRYVNLSNTNLAVVKDSVVSEQYEGVLVIPAAVKNGMHENQIQFLSNDSPSISFLSDMESVLSHRLTQLNFQKANLDTLAIKKATADVSIGVAKATGESTVKGLNEMKIAIGGAFGYLIMMFIVIYGNMVMRSVIEEKTNRIIEIIISSVKPFQLMMGKIIGTSLAGVLQFIIWAILGFTFLTLSSVFFGTQATATPGLSPELMQTAQHEMSSSVFQYIQELWNLPIATILISFVVYFIGGYFLYSSFYAAIGAAVDNETDSQQFLLPIIMPLILGVYIGFFTVMNDPNGTIATVFSMIPLTSPIVMLMRIPFGVPTWQIVLSMAILFATFFLVVWFAAKIYRIGILMYGKKPTWKELYRWLKY